MTSRSKQGIRQSIELASDECAWVVKATSQPFVRTLEKFTRLVYLGGGVEPREFSAVRVKGRALWIDRRTLVLFDPHTGRALTGSPRIVSDAFRPAVKVRRGHFRMTLRDRMGARAAHG